MKTGKARAVGVLAILLFLAACTTPMPQATEIAAAEPPTYTPQSTYTPMPTYTPVPTYTPMPTYTPPALPTVEQPSPTPSPTLTRTPDATSTSAPTRTAVPTSAPTRTTAPTRAPTQTTASTRTPAPTSTAGVTLSSLEQATVDAVNRERQRRGLALLQVDPVLMELARGHAQDMIDRNYFSHTTPEGKTYKMRLREKGIVLNWTGENFYATTSPEGQVVQVTMQWLMGDPSHARNILNVNYTKIGVGVVKNAAGLYMTVQDFTE
jgi:uncharacterized protein YkwD